jgi:hypothetical protein
MSSTAPPGASASFAHQAATPPEAGMLIQRNPGRRRQSQAVARVERALREGRREVAIQQVEDAVASAGRARRAAGGGARRSGAVGAAGVIALSRAREALRMSLRCAARTSHSHDACRAREAANPRKRPARSARARPCA